MTVNNQLILLLFQVNLGQMVKTEKEHLCVEFARELIRLHDEYLSFSTGIVMPRCDL